MTGREEAIATIDAYSRDYAASVVIETACGVITITRR